MSKLRTTQSLSIPNTFGNNISDIINKFERTKKPLVQTTTTTTTTITANPVHRHRINHRATKHIIDSEMKSKFFTGDSVLNAPQRKRKLTKGKRCQQQQRPQSESKMYGTNINDSIESSVDEPCIVSDNNVNAAHFATNCADNNDMDLYERIDYVTYDDGDDAFDNADDIDAMLHSMPSPNANTATTTTKFMRLKQINLIRCQLNLFQRMVGILLCVPFFSSINGAGLTTLTCAFFLPRILCENILYPIFRLILGTLYPAYASYKAVRNKDVKDYVSISWVHFYFCSRRS